MPFKLNGNEAYEEYVERMLERAEGGTMNDDEFKEFVVYSLLTTNRRLKRSEKAVSSAINAFDRHPTLTWLMKKRPRSTIPFLVGLFSLLSSLFVSDIRMYVLGSLGFPGGELPSNAPAIALALTLVGFSLWLIMGSTEKSFSEQEIEVEEDD